MFIRIMAVGFLALVCVGIPVWGDDEPIVSPMQRIDPGTRRNRFGLEFSAAARGNEIVAVWMKRPIPQGTSGNIIMCRAYSTDGGTTWEVDHLDWTGSGDFGAREIDPMSAYDPVSGALFVGGLGGDDAIFFSRREEGASGWSGLLTALDPASGTFDKCAMAAGPRPDDLDESRIYVASVMPIDDQSQPRDLIWSDDLGETWASGINTSAGSGKLPRIGSAGELYIGATSGSTMRLSRSFTISSGIPQFSSVSNIATADSGFNPSWFPGNFRVPRLLCIACDPIDSEKVYAVWADKTSESSGRVNVDLYFTKTTDATVSTVEWDSDSSDPDLDAPRLVPSGATIDGDQFFPWLERDAFGRLHLLWMDGRQNPNQKDRGESGSTPDGLFDVYYAASSNEGFAWTEFRLTPTTFNTLDAGPPDVGAFFYGDYLGMAVAGKRVYCFFGANAGDPLRAEAFCVCIVFGDSGAIDDMTVVKGTILSGDQADIEASEDDRLIVQAPNPASPTLPYETIVDVDIVVASTVDELDLRVEGQSNWPNATGTVRLFNFETDTFDLVGTYEVSQIVDENFFARTIDPVGTGAGGDWDYIRDSDNMLILRLEQSMPQGGPVDALQSMYDFVQVVAVDQ